MKFLDRFWAWYERHYTFNLATASGLFFVQLVHLYWLTTHVVAWRLLDQSFFQPPTLWQTLIVLVDYTEIPALITTSILYIHELRKQFGWKHFGYLFLINSQWLHLFWITDEFILEQFTGQSLVVFPVWLLWVAITIDYLELPVIYDTAKRLIKRLSTDS